MPAGILFVSSQLVSVVLVPVTSVVSPVSVMSVSIVSVSWPVPVSWSVSLVAFLLSFPGPGARPRFGPFLLTRSVSIPVSVSALLRSWCRPRLTPLSSLSLFFLFLCVILETFSIKPLPTLATPGLTWLLAAWAWCICWFCLAWAFLSSSFSLMIFSWLTAILGNLDSKVRHWQDVTLGLPCLKPFQSGDHQLYHLTHRHGFPSSSFDVNFLNFTNYLSSKRFVFGSLIS